MLLSRSRELDWVRVLMPWVILAMSAYLALARTGSGTCWAA
ncbi:MAG: hypothetical protein WDA75_24380 [Candidatus Latescibacterota bacterium]|jgi:hypothetical protein